MTDKQDHTPHSPPVSNYDRALARAVEWLGDRYLLAKPINTHALPRRGNIGVASRPLRRAVDNIVPDIGYQAHGNTIPFGYLSTADQVLAGIDLRGVSESSLLRCNSDISLAIMEALSANGARIARFGAKAR